MSLLEGGHATKRAPWQGQQGAREARPRRRGPLSAAAMKVLLGRNMSSPVFNFSWKGVWMRECRSGLGVLAYGRLGWHVWSDVQLKAEGTLPEGLPTHTATSSR